MQNLLCSQFVFAIASSLNRMTVIVYLLICVVYVTVQMFKRLTRNLNHDKDHVA